MGGYTGTYGMSTANLFAWNPITERHEKISQRLEQPSYNGDCTVIPADAKVLRGCTLGNIKT